MRATSGTALLCHPDQYKGRKMLIRCCVCAIPAPPPIPSTRALRAAVTGPLVGLGTGADTLDVGTGDDALVTHAGGARAVGRLPATAFRVFLSMSQAACVPDEQGGALSLAGLYTSAHDHHPGSSAGHVGLAGEGVCRMRWDGGLGQNVCL